MSAVEARANWKKPSWWVRIGGWALLGGVGGYFGARFMIEGGRELSGSTIFALATALIYLLQGIMVLAGASSARIGLAMKMFDDHEAWQGERGMMINSGLGCLLMSAFLALLLAVDPFGLITVQTGLALALATFMAAAWFTWRTLMQMDELWHKVTSEATVVTFYLVFAPGAAWSAAAHLGLAAPLAPLDWISLFLLASLIGSVIATARRGMIRDS